MKKKILIMANAYIPGVKAGGPIQSIKNLVDTLHEFYEFNIITSDRDLGDDQPYSNVKIEDWNQIGNAKVYYINKNKLTWGKIIKIIKNVDYDLLYLNSFFSYKFSILPILLRKLQRIPQNPVVIAPRGEFSPGALSLKSIKKKTFIKLVKLLGLYNDVAWHATAENEKNDIVSIFGKDTNVKIAKNLTASYEKIKNKKLLEKNIGEIKIIFVSRIHPKKNLKMALELLKELSGKIAFNIYGPIEDDLYWFECKKIINRLPNNVKVSYNGILPHEKVVDAFLSNHIFLFPTLGENFGHVICEALIGGCPVILSDLTPWNEIEKKHAGWVIKLSDKEKFVKVLQNCVDMDQESYNIFSNSAFIYGKNASKNNEHIFSYHKLFNSE